MQLELGSLLVFSLLAVGFVAAALGLGRLIRPSVPEADKALVYECGETPVQAAWFNFNPRFYVVALVFLVLDVEVAFTYPVATVFRRFVATGEGGLAFVEIAAFVVLLALGLAYVWRRRDLDWQHADTPEDDA